MEFRILFLENDSQAPDLEDRVGQRIMLERFPAEVGQDVFICTYIDRENPYYDYKNFATDKAIDEAEKFIADFTNSQAIDFVREGLVWLAKHEIET